MCIFIIIIIILDRAGKDVITRLLDKSEGKRLGSQSGASQVKQHKWFGKINWGLLRNTRPPVRIESNCCEKRLTERETDCAGKVERDRRGEFPESARVAVGAV